ncbi:DUF1553 domain-containing protein [Rhodopirellula sp. JC639]|uniref:DUF1553 domain-containing protein n=1 Tax=Stieleria mannarensis TaxID=2755585 RepID=UPI002570A418|nr:DUF1553 domain-containing protein [Rhodopirellula sp. JC639]
MRFTCFSSVTPIGIFLLLVMPIRVAAGEPAVDFNRDIRPLLFGRCVTCHGPDEAERAAGLRLDTAAGAQGDLGGYAAVVPGDAEASELILRVTSDDPDMLMPPPGKGDPLKPAEITLLRRWIDQGGQYAKHWSYEVPVRPPLPEVSDPSWPAGPIDHFTLARMDAEGLHPSPPADRLTLARRVAIDLTGLPPTWDQAKAFAEDQRADAYEVYVDALLASPAFGERWARVWLDLARYADSAGYADDPPRTIWAYRDYVIRAINDNLPFDQFTIEQIAGDLLPSPTDQQLIATAFHRNTLTNNEGGTNDEEFRNVAVVDRVNTTMAVWMGTTMACAQCHTHKYDPITQDEYFQFFAFFNSTEDADKRNESPLLDVWTDDQKHRKAELAERIETLQAELAAPSDLVDRQRDQWLAEFSSPPDWHPADVAAIESQRALEITDDGWIQADADELERDTYQIQISTSNEPVTGLRLETSASQKRNFVISNLHATWTPKPSSPVQARYVRVDLPGKSRFLHLAEIEAFSGGANVASRGKATQSSTYADAVAARVNDGNTDGDYQKGSVQHTGGENDPWVEIDLGNVMPIDDLVVWNRTDGGIAIIERLNGFMVSLLDDDRNVVWTQQPDGPANAKHALSPSGMRTVSFSHAAADHEQNGFPATAVLQTPADPKTGWAVAPQVGRPHQLTLALDSPTPESEGVLTVTIVQESVHPRHLLDHFRLSVSSDANLTRWATLPAAIREIVAKSKDDRSGQEAKRIDDYFRSIAPALRSQRDQLQSARDELAKMKPMTSVPVMKQLPAEKRRVTKVQLRGNYQSTGDVVNEGTPKAFHPIDNTDNPNRLDLARWLVDPANPLTPRVIVNRHWEQLFGIGIVETSEEFGSQGELPSHPELLDWMAVEFRESGWDVKRLIKSIVMSSTYRQSSVATREAIAADPGNRLLARGPRFRVSAEMVRDQALFVSGLLSDKRFGPPVKPPQPELGLKAAFGSATDWKTSQGEDRYRRGLYTTWRRSSPYPSMAQFDAPNREVCTVRRIRTNTPLQALVTLNDPVYVEAAQAFARNMIQAADSHEGRLDYAFRTALIRPPSTAETERLKQLVSSATETYRQSIDDAMQMATDPLGALPEDADPAEYAAWTVVANVILNLDELLMKR